MKRTLTATSALLCGLAVAGVAVDAKAQFAPNDPGRDIVPRLAPQGAPPAAPNAPAQRPEVFGSYLERGTSVLDRPRPELDPLGVRLGSFFLYPKVEADELYNDNIFATKNGTVDDWITVISPAAELKSNWSNHAIDVKAGASVGTYASHSSENYADYYGSIDGRYDISRYLAAFAGAKFEHLHEERDSPDTDLAAKNPVEYDQKTFNAGIASRGLRIGYQFDVGYLRQDFQNAVTNAGALIHESQRDIDYWTANARVNYEIAPHYEAFARFGFNRRDYDTNSENIVGGVVRSRNSQGYRADLGATIDLTGVTYAEVYGGYVIQDYDDAFYGQISGIDAGARVVWNVTQLTSVTFQGDRRVQDTNTLATSGPALVLSPGYLRSNVGVSVDHELLRNVLLNARFNYQNDEYENIDRTDNRIDTGVGIRYALNRNLYLGGSYTYTNRSSSGTAAGGEFSRNLFLLRLGAQL